MNDYVKNKDEDLSAGIFLTHNKKKHLNYLNNGVKGENILWKPDLQETKISEYGGVNLRYKVQKKKVYINEFCNLHDQIIPWNKIRYIF